ncbi:MAG TPA: 4-hydroxy-tetrahydrodipicolinate reductase [Steroidobacteraceae bacterium]
MINLAVLGITGRMGRALLQVLPEVTDMKLTGALTSPGNAAAGRDVAELIGTTALGVKASCDRDEALKGAHVAIDFTLATAVRDNLRACERHRAALVIGTTALSDEVRAQLTASAASLPILVAPNMSLGVAVLEKLAALAARTLDEEFDADIVDLHHRDKADAPSGTALRLGETIAAARGVNFSQSAILSWEGNVGARQRGKIGFAVVRAGDAVGEHTVHFSGPGETLSLMHRASDRRIFARGAIRAAQWLSRQPPGLYKFHDVIK